MRYHKVTVEFDTIYRYSTVRVTCYPWTVPKGYPWYCSSRRFRIVLCARASILQARRVHTLDFRCFSVPRSRAHSNGPHFSFVRGAPCDASLKPAVRHAPLHMSTSRLHTSRATVSMIPNGYRPIIGRTARLRAA